MKSTPTLALATALMLNAGMGPSTSSPTTTLDKGINMDLGNFSVGLAVKDIHASRAFYDKLGFREVAGDMAQNWIVLQNGHARIGLFQGMLDKNVLTFNPGWSPDKQVLKEFQDVRDIQRTLKARGLIMTVEADEKGAGPAHFIVTDPDGNALLVDQHVPSPAARP